MPCVLYLMGSIVFSCLQWNLVCDDKWMISFVQSLHMLGCMLGGLLFGVISDRYADLRLVLFIFYLLYVNNVL